MEFTGRETNSIPCEDQNGINYAFIKYFIDRLYVRNFQMFDYNWTIQ